MPEQQTERRYIINGIHEIIATDRETALYSHLKKLVDRKDYPDMIEAKRSIVSCVLHPDDRRKRGPARGTPNPFYVRNPHLHSPKTLKRIQREVAEGKRNL